VIKLKREGFLQDFDLKRDTPCWLQGVVPEARAYGVFLLWKKFKISLFYLLPRQSQAERVYQDLQTFCPDKVFPVPASDNAFNPQICQLLYKIDQEKNLIIVSSLSSAIQKVPSRERVDSQRLLLEKGRETARDKLVKWLVERGYRPVPLVEEKGDFSVRGAIVDFFSPVHDYPLRVEFFGDKIESIREFDPRTQRSVRRINQVNLSLWDGPELINDQKNNLHPLIQIVPSSYILVLDEPLELEGEIKTLKEEKLIRNFIGNASFYISTFSQETMWMRCRKKIKLDSAPLSFWHGNVDLLAKDIKNWQEQDYQINIVTPSPGQAERLREILKEKELYFRLKESFDIEENYPLLITQGDLNKGFVFKSTRDILITDRDIFKRYGQRRKRWRLIPEEEEIRSWEQLKEGDYVVHVDYGIGKFKGLVTLNVMGKPGDYFRIDYKGSDRLYVPLSQFDRIHKYVGDSDNPPPVYNLEGGQWELTKRRVRNATRQLASSLLQLYSIRKAKPGYVFSPDSRWQLEFEASFPYEETPDQLKATQEVKRDMESPTPMDRLVCGDAGYGKTEVAIRASFKAVMDGKQVAVLAPTTILAEQHYRNFSERMVDYPVRIEMLSRFQSPGKQQEIIQDLKKGLVDIIIGTHRLIQSDIEFKDLGLVIIDEEQKFGVVQKKKIREFCKTVDVLTLSATPIPRSLYMALTGIFELSTIFSPPRERQNVETMVSPYNEKLVREAILREVSRGGQIFYLYNRVKGIQSVAEKLKKLLPQIRFAVAHGQMRASHLEKTVRDFLHKKYDVLVCTSIVESGIDMPNVNTLIVEDSEKFGLADLYQLRGRVGRGVKKGYAYFLFDPRKPLTEQAKRRLEIIHQFKGPGSSFKIAMEDLHIRGAGNLLGKEQHGHILAVGFTLYSQLLSEEVKKLKGEPVKPSFPVHIELGIEARIPPSYVPDKLQRMQIYQKIGKIEKEEEILEIKEELKDRFGSLPSVVRNLIHLLHIKILARQIGICSIRENFDHNIKITFSPFNLLNPGKKERLASRLAGEVKTFPMDEKNLLLLKNGKKKDESFLIWVRELLQKMKDLLI